MQQLGEGLACFLRLIALLLLLAKLVLAILRRIRVEAEKHLPVAQRVLLLCHGALHDSGAADGAEHGLDFGRVDELADVGLLDERAREEEVLLQRRGLRRAAVDLVERRKRGRRPDDEAAEVAAGRELEQVEREDGARLDAGDVAAGLDDLAAVLLRAVDDERPAALLVSAPSQLTLAGPDLARLARLVDVGTGAERAEKSEGGRGLNDGTTG